MYSFPCSAINSFLAGRLSPSRVSNICSVRAASVGVTAIRRRVAGFIVVLHIMSGSFSPSPLERCKVYFLPSSDLRISAFSNSL